MPIKDKNNIPKLKKRLKKMKNKSVRVGVLGGAEKGLAMIAASNEFGAKIVPKKANYLSIPLVKEARGKSPRDFPDLNLVFPFLKDKKGKNIFVLKKEVIIPERSFLRTSFDDKKNIKEIMKAGQMVFDFGRSLNKVLDTIGLFMVAAIQKKIKSNIPPENVSLTTRMKGGKSRTLVDTGRLGQGITHQIV